MAAGVVGEMGVGEVEGIRMGPGWRLHHAGCCLEEQAGQGGYPWLHPSFRLGLPTLGLGHPLGIRTAGLQESARGKGRVPSAWKPPEDRRLEAPATSSQSRPGSQPPASSLRPEHLLAPVGTQPPLTMEPS